MTAFHTAETLVFYRVIEEPLGHLGDLGIGQAGIGFADVYQPVAMPHGERVIAEHANALAMAILHGGHYDVEGGKFSLHLQPRFSALAWCVR